MISTETLFWAPLGMDLLLLGTTYTCCRFSGMEWYLKTMNQHSSNKKQDDDADITKLIQSEDHPIHPVWDLVSAYSAYGCLLPWAAYVCYFDPSHRTSCAWAMTTLMLAKLASRNAWDWTDGQTKSKVVSILVFYLPTYGGYAVYNTLFKQ